MEACPNYLNTVSIWSLHFVNQSNPQIAELAAREPCMSRYMDTSNCIKREQCCRRVISLATFRCSGWPRLADYLLT